MSETNPENPTVEPVVSSEIPEWVPTQPPGFIKSEPEPEVVTPPSVESAQNNRLPRGARVLRNALQARYPDAEWNGAEAADGFGVIRSVWFSGEAGRFLLQVLPHLEDERIESFGEDEEGRTVVTFVSTTKADLTDPFPLDAAALVAGEDEEPPPPPVAVTEAVEIMAGRQDIEEPEETEPFRDETVTIDPVEDTGTYDDIADN